MIKRIIAAILSGIVLFCTATCGSTDDPAIGEEDKLIESSSKEESFSIQETSMQEPSTQEVSTQEVEQKTFINEQGMTLAERVYTPEGYTRTNAQEGSLTEFLRNYPLKEAGAEVLLYNTMPKGNQDAHVAVFALPIEEYDLQQCADSIMRVYAEYFWSTGQYDRIAFHFTNGFLAEYTKWRDGYRIEVDGNNVFWSKTASYDDSYECFVKYIKMVFTYAGTLSMETEAKQIESDEIQVGDVFLYGASPGHVVLIVDVCVDENGQKAFLLGQGYMPAQEFHLLKNPMHEDDPWYYENEIEYPLQTPEYTFDEGTLKRLEYGAGR
ncbi:MAG: DUF4846 domain-containing protein [Agathobacter sp.]